MLLFSLGLPGQLAQWCTEAISGIASEIGAGCSHFTITALTDETKNDADIDLAALELVRSGSDLLVVSCYPPRDRMFAYFEQKRLPFILAIEDLNASAEYLAATEGLELITSAKVVANACPIVMEYSALPGAMTIRRGDIEGDADIIAKIANHFSISLKSGHAIAAKFKPFIPPHRPASVTTTDSGKTCAAGMLGGYQKYFSEGTLGNLVWRPELFYCALTKAPPTEPIPLRSVANGLCLFHGPYLRLPSGFWVAKLVVSVSKEVVGQTLTIDVYSTRALATTHFSPRAEGTYSISLTFSVDLGRDTQIEIRILVGRNSAPGEMLFGQAELRPISLGPTDSIERIDEHYVGRW